MEDNVSVSCCGDGESIGEAHSIGDASSIGEWSMGGKSLDEEVSGEIISQSATDKNGKPDLEVEQETEEDSGIPIDRGYAWMIVVACFGMHVLCVGGIKSFGVLFVEFQQKFHVSSGSVTIVQALAAFLMLALGPVANVLSIRFSCRIVVFVGGVCVGTGFILTSVVPSFNWVFFTYGILGGLGYGLSYAPCVVMVGHHFRKRRALANGISVSGSGVGSFGIPILMRYLLDEYGFNGSVLIFGAILLNVCVCAALMRPLTSYIKTKPPTASDVIMNQVPAHNNSENGPTELSLIKHISERKKLLSPAMRTLSESHSSDQGANRVLEDRKKWARRYYSVEAANPPADNPVRHRRLRLISESGSIGQSETSLYGSTGDLTIASLQNIPESGLQVTVEELVKPDEESSVGLCRRLCPCLPKTGKWEGVRAPLFDFSLLINPLFLVYAFSVFLANFGYPNIFMMMPSYCLELGMDKATGALMVALIGLSDLVGRIFFGWFSDLKLFPRRYGFMGTMLLSGVLNILLPFVKSYGTVLTFCLLYGFFAGSYVALVAVVLVDCLGVEKLASSFGLTSLAMGIPLIGGPPICGAIKDATKSWDRAFVFCGVLPIVGALIVLLEPLALRFVQRKEEAKLASDSPVELSKTPLVDAHKAIKNNK